jgi:hypothetical protein
MAASAFRPNKLGITNKKANISWFFPACSADFSYNPTVLSYRIDGRFVEIDLGERYTATELRDLFELIRSDQTVPDGALLLFEASARTQVLSEDDVRQRLRMLIDLLGSRVAPAFAAVVSSASALTGQVAQREAPAMGLRCGLFVDAERARRWLDSVAPAPKGNQV